MYFWDADHVLVSLWVGRREDTMDKERRERPELQIGNGSRGRMQGVDPRNLWSRADTTVISKRSVDKPISSVDNHDHHRQSRRYSSTGKVSLHPVELRPCG